MADNRPEAEVLSTLVMAKLDTITEILLTIARQEEKVINLAAQDVRHEKRMDMYDGRLNAIESQFNGPDGLHAKNSRFTAQMAVVILIGVAILNHFVK